VGDQADQREAGKRRGPPGQFGGCLFATAQRPQYTCALGSPCVYVTLPRQDQHEGPEKPAPISRVQMQQKQGWIWESGPETQGLIH
jgi:hypothetical protein